MKPENWDEISREERHRYAVQLANSGRGQYLFGRALLQAAIISRGAGELSNAEDLELLAEELFPYDESGSVVLDVGVSSIKRNADDKAVEEKPNSNVTASRMEANALVAVAFRNGPIEDLHSGKHSVLLEDQSLSRITNAEIKSIMTNACRVLSKFIAMRDTAPDEYRRKIGAIYRQYCLDWEL